MKRAAIYSVIGAYIAVSRLGICLIREPTRQRRFLVKNLKYFSALTLKTLGVSFKSETPPPSDSNALLISNHLSYLDVLVIAAQTPSVFVTSVEVENTPFLGMMARSGGSLFIERRSRTSLKEEVEKVAALLRQGFNVVIFPEGTTSSGEGVLPFKVPLLHAAVEGGTDIQPLCLNYAKINERQVGPEHRDSLFFYGDMEFFPHFKRLLTVDSLVIDVRWLKRLKVSAESKRKELALSAYECIKNAYIPIRPV